MFCRRWVGNRSETYRIRGRVRPIVRSGLVFLELDRSPPTPPRWQFHPQTKESAIGHEHDEQGDPVGAKNANDGCIRLFSEEFSNYSCVQAL